MKKFALALMASAAMVLGVSAVANAYPPAPNVAVVSDSNPGPGETFTVKIGCTAPGTVAYTSDFPDGTSGAVPCVAATGGASLLAAPASGVATLTLTAPTAPGTYTVNYTGAATGNFTITVTGPVTPGGGLPATGSNGTSTMTIIAIGLFAIGVGLFGVSQVRRRTAVV